jgi:hypothetical protein
MDRERGRSRTFDEQTGGLIQRIGIQVLGKQTGSSVELVKMFDSSRS